MYVGKTWKKGRTALCFLLAICLIVSLTPITGAITGNGSSASVVYAADDEDAVWDGSVSYDWYFAGGGATGTNFTIKTPADLAGFAKIVSGLAERPSGVAIAQNAFAGCTITLAADLDMGGVYDEVSDTWSGPTWHEGTPGGDEWWIRNTYGYYTGPQWYPIGGYPALSKGAYNASSANRKSAVNNPFNGTFDGGYHSIINIVSLYPSEDIPSGFTSAVDADVDRIALFNNIGTNGKVKNVIVDSGTFEGDQSAGSIVGQLNGTIENCANYATVYSGYRAGAGGIAGVAMNGGVIRNSFNGGDVISENSASGDQAGNNMYASVSGGIVGYAQGGLIENCYNYGYVESYKSTPGAIVGHTNVTGTNTLTVNNSYSVNNDLHISNTDTDVPANVVGSVRVATNAPVIGLGTSLMLADDMRELAFADTIDNGTGIFTYDEFGDNDGFPMFYQQWVNANTFIIDYDEGDGTMPGDAVLEKSVFTQKAYGKLPTPIPEEGYYFTGWHLDSETGDLITEDSIVELDDDATLYASYGAYPYVEFDEGDGEMPKGAIEGFWIISGQIYTLPTPIAPEGYSFDGWHLNAVTGAAITPANAGALTSDATLYAAYAPKTYRVTYNAAGGKVATAGKDVIFDAPYGELTEPTKKGYYFVDWTTEPEGEGDVVRAKTIVETAMNHNLYASWEAADLVVTFKPNGKNVRLEIREKELLYDSEYKALPYPTRTGYKFNGWYTKAKGGVEVDYDTIVTKADDHNLYAHWVAKKYTIQFNENSSRVKNKVTGKKYTYGKAFKKLPTPTRRGYKFLGWYTQRVDGKRITEKTIHSYAKTKSLYAHWKRG